MKTEILVSLLSFVLADVEDSSDISVVNGPDTFAQPPLPNAIDT